MRFRDGQYAKRQVWTGRKKNRHIEMRRRCYYLMKTLFADKYNVNGK
jgi:hypothetical protein